MHSSVTGGLSQEGDLAERGPLAAVGGPLASTQKKTWEMVVDPDMEGNKKPEINGKYNEERKKQQPTENQKNTKIEI